MMTSREKWEQLEKEYSSAAPDANTHQAFPLEQTLAKVIRKILATDFADLFTPVVSMGIYIHIYHPRDVDRWDEGRPSVTFVAFHGAIMDVFYTFTGDEPEIELRKIPAGEGEAKVMELLERLRHDPHA